MMLKHWTIITPSEFEHERRALDFVRAGLPDHDPYRAWANFEFQTPDGALYEVDLLVLGKGGFWLVEIKSRPGRLEGDVGTWTWTTPDGRRVSDDNPIHLANKKSKAIAGILRPHVPRGVRLPFLEPLVFLSDPDLDFRLTGSAANHVCLTDRPADDPRGPRDGVLAALTARAVPGARPLGDVIDAKVARAVTQAMDKAGLRPSQKERRVGDYLLGELLLDVENCFQDRVARHATLKDRVCRARQYLVARAATEDQRKRIRGAAEREFRILDGLDHPNVLRVLDFKDHGFGPVLTFQHHPGAVRLDHFLRDRGPKLTAAQRLGLLRQLADGVRYAQARRVIHRALAPQSVLVTNPEADAPVPKVFNWQVGVAEAASSSGTTHAEELVDQVALVYMAPEAGLTPKAVTPTADVFSLGAVAFHLFAGRPPASSLLERGNLLREHGGLDLAAVLDGAGPRLVELVRDATHPDVARRIPTADEFYRRLDEVEAELVAPEGRRTADPDLAQKGDQLDDGFEVVRQLGQGSTGKALLVTRDGAEYVLKVARGPDDNPRLRDEGEVLAKVRSAYVVGLHAVTEMHGRTVLVLDKAGDRTLAAHLREFGKCDLEWQERFGTDLLQALCDLEQAGVFHRDVKPDNVGIRDGKQRRQLVLFDFSLSRAPLDNLRVGTPPYLDPFLSLRTPPRWDPAAERYAAAVTLYEMATGGLPRYGDGKSDPALTADEFDPDLGALDAPVRDGLARFFRQSLHRDPAKRFDSAERMKRAWAKVFDEADKATVAVAGKQVEVAVRLEEVRPDTFVELLGLSARARGALQRLGVATVRDFLGRTARDFQFQQNVGEKTRRELIEWLGRLRERFPDEAALAAAPAATVSEDVTRLGLVALRDRLVGKATARDKRAYQIRCHLLGLEGGTAAADGSPAWPPITEVADRLALSRQRIHQVLIGDRLRWDRDPAVKPLREEVVEAVYRAGGVLTGRELAEVILAGRGIDELAEADRPRVAAALARIVYESEQVKPEPRLTLRRARGGVVLLACSTERADHAVRLGEIADELAAEDPAPSVTRALERLLQVTAPPLPAGCEPFGNERLLRVAVSLSRTAALNPNQVYPRGMPALKALKVGAGAFNNLGLADAIAPDEIRRRVAARYPEAEPLPERPALDELIKAAGFELEWDDDLQAYRRPGRVHCSSSGTSAYSRQPTNTPPQTAEITPENAAAWQLEEKLSFALKDGGFLALSVVPKAMEDCEAELVRRFHLERVSLDALILDRLAEESAARKVKWEKVLAADAAPRDSRDWQNLLRLVGYALPKVEADLVARTAPTLLVHPGLLARYDALGVIDRLRDEAGRPGMVPVLWLLIAADEQRELPTIDGKAVPLITPGQRATVPLAWVYNHHRGNGVDPPKPAAPTKATAGAKRRSG